MQTIQSDGVTDAPTVLHGAVESQRQKALLKTGALQDAIFNSAYFSSIATDEAGVIQILIYDTQRRRDEHREDVAESALR